MNLKKNHYSRRALALLLTLVMVLSLLPGTALAVNDSSAPAVTYADLADIKAKTRN